MAFAQTIVDNVQNDMTLAREEVFGPVLNVMRMDNLEDAIAQANKSSFGNGAAKYSSTIWCGGARVQCHRERG